MLNVKWFLNYGIYLGHVEKMAIISILVRLLFLLRFYLGYFVVSQIKKSKKITSNILNYI